jgi:hypothetical protein
VDLLPQFRAERGINHTSVYRGSYEARANARYLLRNEDVHG